MCNLYSLTPKRDDIGRFFRVSHNSSVAFEPVNAIFPRHIAPVVRQSSDGEREIVLMSWGFFRLEKGRAPKPVTNVRDDQIQTNPFWRDSFKQRRCLVPGVWRDNLDENGAAMRMRSGGRGVSWSRRTRTEASPL